MRKYLVFALVPALLAGCASVGDYPSLARRPFEKPGSVATPSPPAPATASDPALLRRVADALKQARDGVTSFDETLPAALEAARRASGSAEGSEPWIAAQLAISVLERTLSPAHDALASLDDERRFLDQYPGSPDLPVVQAAVAEVEAIDSRQSLKIRELLALLK